MEIHQFLWPYPLACSGRLWEWAIKLTLIQYGDLILAGTHSQIVLLRLSTLNLFIARYLFLTDNTQ